MNNLSLTKLKINCVDKEVSDHMIEAIAINLLEDGYDWGVLQIILFNHRKTVFVKLSVEMERLSK